MYTLAHLSDLHIFSSAGTRMSDFLNKRFYGYWKWRLQRHAEHQNDILRYLADDLRQKQPDHTVLTGDLVHLSLPDEYLKADNFVRVLGIPQNVTIIPGNHDAYIRGSLNQSVKAWINYMRSDENYQKVETANGTSDIFPVVRIRKDVALIGLSTAVPCSPLLAVGEVGNEQRRALAKILSLLGKQCLFRVLMIHHPPVSGVVSWRKRLIDQDAVCSILNRFGVELILHGHAHRVSNSQIETINGPIPVIGLPSASAKGRSSDRRSRYNLYCIERNQNGWQIVMTTRKLSNAYDGFESEIERKFEIRDKN